MLGNAKIALSQHELQLVVDTEHILTKRLILTKVSQLLATLQIAYSNDLQQSGLAGIGASIPKISKGDNYLQLPYLVLDYPKLIDKEDIFLIRTMFWWGNFFSLTLHLSGKYKNTFQKNIGEAIDKIAGDDFFIGIDTDAWQHHFEKENYLLIKDLGIDVTRKIITEHPFIKIAVKFPLQQWDNVDELLQAAFRQIIQLLKN